MVRLEGWEKYATTVGELKQKLAKLPDDLVIVLSKDGEGNSYSPLSSVGDGYSYVPDSTWSGEVHHRDDCEEDEDRETDGPCDHSDCRYSQGTPAVVFGPVN